VLQMPTRLQRLHRVMMCVSKANEIQLHATGSRSRGNSPTMTQASSVRLGLAALHPEPSLSEG
jgi:hypothetical protein